MSELSDKIKKHNKEVHEAFERANQGEVIDLTALMISKEKIDEEKDELERAKQEALEAANRVSKALKDMHYGEEYDAEKERWKKPHKKSHKHEVKV